MQGRERGVWGSCAGEGERGVGKLCRGGREGCGEGG